MYKCKHNLLPSSCAGIVTIAQPNSHYTFRMQSEFVLSSYRTEWRKKDIAIAGPNLWNSMSNIVKESCSISAFKNAVKESVIIAYTTM